MRSYPTLNSPKIPGRGRAQALTLVEVGAEVSKNYTIYQSLSKAMVYHIKK
jgi:hypothetical protein